MRHDPSTRPTPPAPDTAALRASLERHQCPTPFHVVRARLMGAIASPAPNMSVLQTVQQLWGEAWPAFDTPEDLQALLTMLIADLWNPLTAHQHPDHPFLLTPVALTPTRKKLRHFADVRRQEIDGFIDGLFGGHNAMDLPETAHDAVRVLQDVRAMLAGTVRLLNDSHARGEDLRGLARNIQEIAAIAEGEINAAIQSCTRARDQRTAQGRATTPTTH